MQKVILDTNVIVSSLLQRNYPYLVIDSLLAKRDITICLSEPLFIEYNEVLQRPKFSKFPDFVFRAEALLANIEDRAIFFYPQITLNIISDFADNRLLELAEESNADFIVTGNTNDFTFENHKSTRIILPRHYYELCCI